MRKSHGTSTLTRPEGTPKAYRALAEVSCLIRHEPPTAADLRRFHRGTEQLCVHVRAHVHDICVHVWMQTAA